MAAALAVALALLPLDDGSRSSWLALAQADDDGGDSDGDGGDGNDGGGDNGGGDGGGDSDGGRGGDSDPTGREEDRDGDDDDDDDEGERDDAAESEEASAQGNAEAVTDRLIRQGGIEHLERELLALEASPGALAAARRLGAEVLEERELARLGLRVARLRVPPSASLARLKSALNDLDQGRFDFNHAYRPAACSGPGCDALGRLGWAGRPAACGGGLRLGIVDGPVDGAAAGIPGSRLQQRRLADGPAHGDAHGTRVAALLAGAGAGVLPAARVLAADVYRVDVDGRSLALTDDLLDAMDWLAGAAVDVVNMSLAGPPNEALRAGIGALEAQGIGVVAAAGNGGPLAPPAYPGAYPPVLAATAVDERLQVFPRANRGPYVALAAPGVDLPTVDGARVSGTSFASVFVAAALADAQAREGGLQAGRRALRASARDLGPPGPDETYGAGLLGWRLSCLADG
ncbi:hypothetical protein DEM34_13620 [Spiribacter halobius]|uniref:Peptidase S8/S53 domain-containing protein n=2 Tax=Sediminicurvatus halobius TaxID=2182432 RepID=A0A2U2MZ60_9GAMM|nr:hypothetical protein DEM34_13620 [Spiribacter halobius]